MFIVNTEKHILLQWILCSYCYVNCLVWEYDEMKCNLVFEFFYNARFTVHFFEVQILVIWNNHESSVWMNGNVKDVEI
jgi:hypothetical protein